MGVSRKCLVALLASKKNYIIPKEKHVLHDPNWSFKTDKYCISNVLNHPELYGEIKDTILTPYREGAIPMALNLARKGCSKTANFVQNEIESALESGGSMIFTNPQDSKIIAISLSFIWQRNNMYEVIGADLKSWHNAAAEVIARNPKRDDNHLIWRNYQTQHAYDIGQKLMLQMPEKKYALYFSLVYVDPKYRQSGSSLYPNLITELWNIRNYGVQWNLADSIAYGMTTFTKMSEKKPHYGHYGHFKPFDFLSYEEEELVLDGGRCFEKFKKLGGMTFYVDYLEDFTNKA